jgi:hypothetical protein
LIRLFPALRAHPDHRDHRDLLVQKAPRGFRALKDFRVQRVIVVIKVQSDLGL